MCDRRRSHLRRLILVTYASSQRHGKTFLIEHVVNVKTLNGSELDDDLLNDGMDFMLSQVAENISFFFIEIENVRSEGKIWMRHTHDNVF